jgi:hypothetical protein
LISFCYCICALISILSQTVHPSWFLFISSGCALFVFVSCLPGSSSSFSHSASSCSFRCFFSTYRSCLLAWLRYLLRHLSVDSCWFMFLYLCGRHWLFLSILFQWIIISVCLCSCCTFFKNHHMVCLIFGDPIPHSLGQIKLTNQ